MTTKPKPPDQDDDDLSRRVGSTNKSLRELGGNSVSAGLTFGFTLVAFTLIGVWLDSVFSTRPLFLLLGLGLGGVGGFIHLVETVSPGTLFRARRPDRLEHPPKDQTTPPAPDQSDSDDDDPP